MQVEELLAEVVALTEEERPRLQTLFEVKQPLPKQAEQAAGKRLVRTIIDRNRAQNVRIQLSKWLKALRPEGIQVRWTAFTNMFHSGADRASMTLIGAQQGLLLASTKPREPLAADPVPSCRRWPQSRGAQR